MARYRCTECGKEQDRDDLTVKRVQFRGMGARGVVVATRVTAWLCGDCLAKDEVFTTAPHKTPSRQRA